MNLYDVNVPDNQALVHKTFEAVAVFAVAPFMGWLATQKSLPPWARVASGIICVGTLAVDGWLLWQYVKE